MRNVSMLRKRNTWAVPTSNKPSQSFTSASRMPRPGARPPKSRSTSKDAIPSWLRTGGTSAWLLLGILIVASAAVWLAAELRLVFVALFLALVLASLLNPLVNFLDKFMPRLLGVFISLLTLVGLAAALVSFVVYSVSTQWAALADSFGNGIDLILDFLRATPIPVEVSRDELYAWLNDLTNTGLDYLKSNAGALATELLSNAGTFAFGATIFVLAIFITLFFLFSGTSMWRWFLNRLPARYRLITHEAASAGWFTFSGYARGTIIIATTNAFFAYLWIEFLHVPLSPALAVIVFIGSFIPLIGAPTAMFVSMIVGLAAHGVWTAVFVGIGVALIGQIEGHILQPFIMGSQVSLHPAVVGLGVTAGTIVAGIFGAIVAIPIISVIWSVYCVLHTDDPPIEGELPVYKHHRGLPA